MKNILKTVILAAFLAIAPVLLFSQNPPHPNDGLPPTGGTTVGSAAGAPIGNGSFILFTFALAYAVRKIYVVRSAPEAE